MILIPLSRPLLEAILADQLSDRFVCELVWTRLGYQPLPGAGPGAPSSSVPWRPGPGTPADWAQAFPEAPQLIAERRPSVQLTRSIPAVYKQLLKSQFGFSGYKIGELFPRRTRRATAVSWLLAYLAARGEPLLDNGPLPDLLEPPSDPLRGHPGDPVIG